MDDFEPRGDFIELSEEQLEEMFKYVIDPEAEDGVPEEVNFGELYGEEYYRERFPGFSDEAYAAMACKDEVQKDMVQID